jgi:hypothetical protein
MAILFEPVGHVAESLTFALGAGTTVTDSMPTLLRALDMRPDVTLVVIGPNVYLEQALQFSAAQQRSRPARRSARRCEPASGTW